jgi:hypothetical protein
MNDDTEFEISESTLDLRPDLSRLSACLRDTARLLAQGSCTPAEAAKMLRELAEDLQPPVPPVPDVPDA